MSGSSGMLEHDWFDAPLPANMRIGERSWLYSSFAFLHFQSRLPEAVKIGSDSGLYAGTFFELGPRGSVEIGNFCSIVGAIFSTNQSIKIGDYVFIAHEVVIADSWHAVPFTSEEPHPAVEVEAGIIIASNAWIGAGAVLLKGARVGKGAVVGAATVLDFEVPDYAIAAGNPAKICGWTRQNP